MNKILKDLAGRIGSIRVSDPAEATPYNFAFGAIYALEQADQCGYPQQSIKVGRGSHLSGEANRLANEMSSTGTITREQDWIAGYYFNDAIIRMAVSFEHIARQATGLTNNERMPKLKEEVLKKKDFPADVIGSWDKAQLEMNNLRHNSQKFVDGPDINFEKALNVVKDLVQALEWFLNKARPLADS